MKTGKRKIMKKSIKIGHVRIGVEIESKLLHKLSVFVTIDGWRFRRWRKRIRLRGRE